MTRLVPWWKLSFLVQEKKDQRRAEFFEALVRAFLYHRHNWNMQLWKATYRFLRAMLRAMTPQAVDVPFGVYKRRIQSCRYCRLYDHARRVCGNDGPDLVVSEDSDDPLELRPWMVDGEARRVPRGCRCWIPKKAKFRDSKCFREEIGLPSYWPE